MVRVAGKVKHVCCSVCLFIVVLGLEQHTFPSVLAQEESVPMIELMSWGAGGQRAELQIPEPPNSKPSLVVLLVNDKLWTDPNLEGQNGRFSVSAPPNHGLMAVIQILNLRTAVSTGSGVTCKDYIKLSDVHGPLTTPRICGELKKENKSLIPENLIGPRVFRSPSGKMDIEYASDKGDASDEPSQQKSMQIVEIVFTPYSECLEATFRDQIRCGDKCISHELSCDEHINCGFEEDFGSDEVSCVYQDVLGKDESIAAGRPHYLVTLYLAAFLFFIIIAAIAFYHRHTTYQRIKNIPT